MERYDGKTKRDDYIKYGAIALGVLLVIVGLCLLTSYLKHRSQKEPDLTVVFGCRTAINQAMREDLETVLGSLAEDSNGDGEVVVNLQVLRFVDAQTLAINLDSEMPSEMDSQEGTAGVSSDDAFQRMSLYLADGEHNLFLLSDEVSGDFPGAATAYCKEDIFAELPEDLADETNPYRTELTNAPFLQELGLEDIPFYGCVLDDRDSALEILRNLKTAHVTLW